MLHDSMFEVLGQTVHVPAYAKQIALAATIGLAIGLERELRGKPASLRTFSVIAVGSCLFSLLSMESGGLGSGPYDHTRISAQIVSGIGFLGGGVIFKTTDRIAGITTGALIWLAAAMGMACGFNQTGIVFWACIIGIATHFCIYTLYEIIYFFRSRAGHDVQRKGH